MAYDERVAERIRALLGDPSGFREQKMFGGLAFLIGGNMAVAASGQGGIMVRTDPARPKQHARDGAEPMEMRGRPMSGWVLVDAGAIETDDALAEWVEIGVTYARSLPVKPTRAR